jgi:hypothetical protein
MSLGFTKVSALKGGVEAWKKMTTSASKKRTA